MYLIDNTYLINKLEIAGINESNNCLAEKLDNYIDIYVVDFLQSLLGAVSFIDLNSNVSSGVLSNSAPQKWMDLVNGATYTVYGITYIWKGLIYTQGTVKRSILTNLVYCKIIADLETNNGKMVLDAKNVTKNVMRRHYVDAWNELAKQLDDYSNASCHSYYHNGVLVTDWLENNNENGYVTLAKFLVDNKADYPNVNVNLKEAQILNYLDIG